MSGEPIRALVQSFLEVEGQQWDVIFATSGTEAVDKFRDGDFDFVLLDFMMPGLDGLAAAKAIRREGYAGPLVIWSSAGIMVPYDQAEAIDAGVLDKGEIRKLLDLVKAASDRFGINGSNGTR